MKIVHVNPDDQAMLDKIIIWTCEQSLNKAQVRNLIRLDIPDITDEDVSNLMHEAFQKLAAIHNEQNNPVEIINEHVAYYEHIYSYFKSIDNAAGMNRAMDRKERLLNILKTGNRVTLRRSETTINFNRSSPVEYDLHQLTSQQQDRLKYLYQKATAS